VCRKEFVLLELGEFRELMMKSWRVFWVLESFSGEVRRFPGGIISHSGVVGKCSGGIESCSNGAKRCSVGKMYSIGFIELEGVLVA